MRVLLTVVDGLAGFFLASFRATATYAVSGRAFSREAERRR